MDIMQAIMDIEQKAQGIVEAADELKAHQEEILDKEICDLNEKMLTALNSETEKIRREYNSIRDDEMAKTERKYAEKFEALEEKFSRGRSKWISDIYNAVLEQPA